MRTGLICFLLTLSFPFCFAQTDYVVTIKGDTLRGDVKLLTYDLIDRAQISVDKKKTTYTALQVRSISFKGEIYHTQRYDNAIRFMKLIKPGYLGYYAFRQGNQVTYDGRMLVKRDGKSIEVPNIGFKKVMASFLQDCEAVAIKIKDDVYKRSELDKIIDDYNSCIENKTLTQQQAVVAIAAGSEKNDAVKALQTKVTALDDFAAKKDVTDLLADISDKITRQQAIPNYQLEALKSLLSGKESVKAELDKVIGLLKVN